MYHGKCRFYPRDSVESNSNRWLGSLMYRTSVPSINTYCRDIESPTLKHLKHAPTIHNLKCNKRSVWEVATSSEDLANRTVSDTVFEETEIEVMIETARRIVVAIDLSTSMRIGNRFKSVMQAASIFLQSAAIDTWIGMISFNKAVQIRSNLVQITDDDTRKVLIQRLPDMSELAMGTSLGGAVQAGVGILTTTGPESLKSTGGEILLLTDGVETAEPKLSDVLQTVKASGIRVNAISLGVQAIDGVEMISLETGGTNSFATSATDGSNHMLQTLSSAFLAQFQNDEGQPLTVVSENIPVNGETVVPFVLDNSVGRDTNIFLSWGEGEQPSVKLKLPDETVVANNWVSDDFQSEINFEDVKFSTITVKIVGLAGVGRYDIIIENSRTTGPMQITCTVNSFPRDESYPVKMSTHAVNRESGEVSIFAEVSQGLFPVLDATLYAQLIHPELNETSVDTVKYYLHDDGLDDDLNAEDGVYTTTVSPPQDGVAYIIKVVGIGEGSSAYVSRKHFVGWGPKDGLDVRTNREMAELEATYKYRRSAENDEVRTKIDSDKVSVGANARETIKLRLSGGKKTKHELLISGYFNDRDIQLTIPVVDVTHKCCETFRNRDFEIVFTNDQANDKLFVMFGRNAAKGKYELTLQNSGGRGQLVQYEVFRIEDIGKLFEPTDFSRTTSLTLKSNVAAKCPRKFLYYKKNCWYAGNRELLTYKTASEQCRTFGAELPLITDDKSRVDNFKWAVYNNYPFYQFWVDEDSTGRPSNPAAEPSALYTQSYSSKELDFPTAQEFADFQEEVRKQRALVSNNGSENDSLYARSCSYFSGRRNNNNHINDAVIKEPQACALELPYTCIYKIPDKVPPKQIVDIDLEVIDEEERRKENEDEKPSQEKYDTFLGKDFRQDDRSYVPAKNLTYKLTFTTPKDAGISKNLTTEIRMFLDPDAKFESGRLVKEISSKEKADVILTDDELVKCPPNLPIDLKFWIHTKSDEQNQEAARLIEEIVTSTLHMGDQETNLLFDIWTGNSSAAGKYAPIHNVFKEKYKPRHFYKSDVYQQYNIWIGEASLTSRVTKLKTNTTREADLEGIPLSERGPIKFLVEKRIDQSRSMVTKPVDYAADLIGQAKLREVFEALCSEQIYFNRQIRAAAKDEDGNLAEESLGRSFIQILSKAEQQRFHQIKVPSPARQEEVREVVVKKNTGAIAGTVAGVVVVMGSLIGCALFSGQIKTALTGGGDKSKKGKKGGAKKDKKVPGKKDKAKKGGAKKGAKKKGKK